MRLLHDTYKEELTRNTTHNDFIRELLLEEDLNKYMELVGKLKEFAYADLDKAYEHIRIIGISEPYGQTGLLFSYNRENQLRYIYPEYLYLSGVGGWAETDAVAFNIAPALALIEPLERVDHQSVDINYVPAPIEFAQVDFDDPPPRDCFEGLASIQVYDAEETRVAELEVDFPTVLASLRACALTDIEALAYIDPDWQPWVPMLRMLVIWDDGRPVFTVQFNEVALVENNAVYAQGGEKTDFIEYGGIVLFLDATAVLDPRIALFQLVAGQQGRSGTVTKTTTTVNGRQEHVARVTATPAASTPATKQAIAERIRYAANRKDLHVRWGARGPDWASATPKKKRGYEGHQQKQRRQRFEETDKLREWRVLDPRNRELTGLEFNPFSEPTSPSSGTTVTETSLPLDPNITERLPEPEKPTRKDSGQTDVNNSDRSEQISYEPGSDGLTGLEFTFQYPTTPVSDATAAGTSLPLDPNISSYLIRTPCGDSQSIVPEQARSGLSELVEGLSLARITRNETQAAQNKGEIPLGTPSITLTVEGNTAVITVRELPTSTSTDTLWNKGGTQVHDYWLLGGEIYLSSHPDSSLGHKILSHFVGAGQAQKSGLLQRVSYTYPTTGQNAAKHEEIKAAWGRFKTRHHSKRTFKPTNRTLGHG
jgi:hypothetical protein